MMTDQNNACSKNGFSVETNGLGMVLINVMGQEKPLYLTPEQAHSMGQQLTGKATDADWQNRVS
jgi:hypothetical protein